MISETEWLKVFSEELQYHLKENNMSQKDLAQMSRLSESVVNDYVHGRKIPGARAIINMSYALDINPEELIDFGQTIE